MVRRNRHGCSSNYRVDLLIFAALAYHTVYLFY
jgi:hypothetical protein